MNCCALFLNSTIFPITINIKSVTFKNQSFFLRQSSVVSANLSTITKHKSLSSVHSNSLRVLEWDKLCDSVSSFATTSFGREATKVSLSLSQTLLQILNECFIILLCFFCCFVFLCVLGTAVVSESNVRRESEAFGRDQCGRGNVQPWWL